MGRPRKTLTPEQIEQVEALAKYLTQMQLADYFKMNRDTFAAIMARDERVRQAYERGSAQGVAAIGRQLFKEAMEGNTTAAIFYLKAKGGWREVQRTEVTGPDGGPIENNGPQVHVYVPENGRDQK